MLIVTEAKGEKAPNDEGDMDREKPLFSDVQEY